MESRKGRSVPAAAGTSSTVRPAALYFFARDGTKLGKSLVPEVVGDVCFGGFMKNRLYICGTTSLYAVLTHVNGPLVP